MAGLIGRKIGMTRIFDERGGAVPVTVVEAGPCPVVQLKTEETDGYRAVQVGFGQKSRSEAARRNSAMRPPLASTTRLASFASSA